MAMQRRLSIKTEVFEIQVENSKQRSRQNTIVEIQQIDSGDEDDFDNQKYIDEAFSKVETENREVESAIKKETNSIEVQTSEVEIFNKGTYLAS